MVLLRRVFLTFFVFFFPHLVPVVQTLDSAIHWINLYPVDRAIDFLILIRWIVIYPVDNTTYRINLYPVDSAIDFLIRIRWIVIYPMDSAIQRLNNRGLGYRLCTNIPITVTCYDQ